MGSKREWDFVTAVIAVGIIGFVWWLATAPLPV